MKAAARTLLFPASLLAACSASAQPFYQEVTASHLPPGLAGSCMDALAGDADGDGDADLVLAMEFEPNILLQNDGAGRFLDASDQLPRSARDSEDTGLADFDSDGDLDLVFVSEDDRFDEFWRNDGGGRFTDASDRLGTDVVSNALAVMDLNGDGVPDLLIGNIGINRVLISDGQGGFRDETEARWPQDTPSRTQDIELADIDGDGALDVIVANEGQNQLFLNEEGHLVEATASHLPARVDETREIRAADLDGDNDLDLAVANVRFGMQESPRDYLLINEGGGRFALAEAARLPEDARSNFTLQLVDLDGDGDQDMLAPSTVFPSNEIEVLASFEAANGSTGIARASSLSIEDADSDGDQDAVLSTGNRSYTLLYEGGRLAPAPDAEAWEDTLSLDAIDIDGDDLSDLGVSNISSAPAPASDTAAITLPPLLQVFDFGENGSIDLFITVNRAMDAIGDYLVLLNDGAANFSVASPGSVLPAGVDGNGFDIEVADFNGDGRADLFLCNRASVSGPETAADTGGLQRLLLRIDGG